MTLQVVPDRGQLRVRRIGISRVLPPMTHHEDLLRQLDELLIAGGHAHAIRQPRELERLPIERILVAELPVLGEAVLVFQLVDQVLCLGSLD